MSVIRDMLIKHIENGRKAFPDKRREITQVLSDNEEPSYSKTSPPGETCERGAEEKRGPISMTGKDLCIEDLLPGVTKVQP